MWASPEVNEVKGTAEGSASHLPGPQGLRQFCDLAQGPRKAQIFAQKLIGWAAGGLRQQPGPRVPLQPA